MSPSGRKPAGSARQNLLSAESTDPALDAKMDLVNTTIDRIGFTGHHIKLFFLNGFGYAVDSLILLLQSIIAGPAGAEFNPSFRAGLTIAAYVGMLVGALVWGLSADLIGRRLAFNLSLLISGVFTLVAGASPSWVSLGTFVCFAAFGAGGNLVLDTTVFLEYLPSSKTWLITLMAAWWGVGQLVAGLLAWAFLPTMSCEIDTTGTGDVPPCDPAANKGWRYVWYSAGALVIVMSILRVTVVRLDETPKFLISHGRDKEVVRVLSSIARKYNRPCSLTVEALAACDDADYDGNKDIPPAPVAVDDPEAGGVVRPRTSSADSDDHGPVGRVAAAGDDSDDDDDNNPVFSLHALRSIGPTIGSHLRGLFSTRRIGRSTLLIWFSWTVIGLAYPLYNIFLPSYLASRGADFGQPNPNITWRNYAFANIAGIAGPVPAAFMSNSRYFWGRRGTMVIGAVATGIFFFAYTHVRSASQNVGFTCAISFCLNVYYGTLYAYTPEVLPSAHRGTGNGIAIAANRAMGILSAVIGTVADVHTAVPIYICAGLYMVLAVTATLFPFEPLGRQGS